MRRNMCWIGCIPIVLLLAMPVAWAEDDEQEREMEGTVEILYRNVSQDGSSRKYDEDFDGLDSGGRLSSLEFDWYNIDSGLVDFLHLDAGGIGDPYERSSFRMGRKDMYELRLSHTKQSYLYNLFQLEGDQDASTWNTDRSTTEFGLTYHAARTVDLFFDFQQVQRDGTSFFMKDVNTELFQLETPLDQKVRRYSLGGRFQIGQADLLIRHTIRRNNHNIHSTTTGNAGLSTADLVTLDQYDWVQNESGGADLTTVTFSMPLGERVNLKATAFGTLLGEEDMDSQVTLDAVGTSFLGTCTVSGATCDAANPCDFGIPGNVCVANPFSISGGTSTAEIEADHLVLGGDLSVRITDSLDFHLQVKNLSREITGIHDRDLDGNGVPDDTEGIVNDTTPGSTTTVEYELTTITGLFDYEPTSKVRIRAGYRSIDRELERSGFEYGTTEYRNTNFESSGDDTLILGFKLKPLSWFHMDADYEQGDMSQAFTAASPMETDRLRVRARLRRGSTTRLDFSYMAYENSNTGVDFRRPGDCGPGGDVDSGCWNSLVEGTTLSARLWHKAGRNLDFWLRWAQHDIDRVSRIHFDTDVLFGSTEVGDSVYDSNATEWAGQVNFSWASPWRAFVRAQINKAEGNNAIAGTTFSSNLVILQDYSDIEAGVTYSFTNSMYVGAQFRSFDFDDENDNLDYDGEILSIVGGLHF